MLGDNELQIVLSLIDNASAKLKEINANIKADTAGVTDETKKQGEESEKTNKKQQDGLMATSKELRSFRRELFAVTMVITSITLVSKAWAENNLKARMTLDSLGESTNKFMGYLGSILSPIVSITSTLMEWASKVEGAWAAAWAGIRGFFSGGLEGAKQSYLGFIKEMVTGTNFKQMTDQMKLMTDTLARIDLMYMTGKLTAEQYYTALVSGSNSAFQADQMRMNLNKQLAEEENLMRNQSLLDFSTDVRSRMDLLKTLQDYHHTVYSSMMDFSNTFIKQFSTGMTTALTSVIMGTKKAGEAFKEFGISLITTIIEFVVQYGVEMLIAAALAKVIMASTIAEANAIAAAWIPAAIYASIATLGVADAAGAAGMAAASASGLAVGMATMAASKAIDLGTITVSKPAAHAEGGWVGLNGPELGLLGERGPEYVIPNNRLDSMGNQTSIHIEVNNPSVRSDEDIDRLTEEISQRLAREAERL